MRFRRLVVVFGLGVLGCAPAPRGPTTAAVGSTRPAVPEPAQGAPAELPAPAEPAATAAEEAPGAPAEPEPRAPDPSARAWLGVELEAAAPEAGVRVGRVVPRSPAAQAGLEAGDLIQRLDEQPVSTPASVIAVVAAHAPGARVGVALRRGGASRLLAVTLGSYPERDELYRMSFVNLPAPPLEELATAKGTFRPTLAAQRGRVLLVEFWAPWCVACRALIPHMNQLHADLAARGLSVVGITGDPVARAAEAAGELGMEFPIASDETGKTMRAYDARAIPAVFVIDRRGTVRDVMVGYDPARVAQVDALVKRLLAER